MREAHKESWAPKNWCFWTVVLEKTLESPLDSKEIQPVHPKGNQSWIFIEGLMLKLKLQYFGHLMQRTHWKRPWWWERLKAGEEGDDREWDGWMASVTRWKWVWASSGSWWWTGKPGVLQSVGLQSRTRLSDWIELNVYLNLFPALNSLCNTHHNLSSLLSLFNCPFLSFCSLRCKLCNIWDGLSHPLPFVQHLGQHLAHIWSLDQ